MRAASPRLAGRGRAPASTTRTVQLRTWKGVNLTDARTAIDDSEFSWLENALTIGNGQIQLLPGPGASVSTFTQGAATVWGFTLNGSPVNIVIGADGSITQVTPTGTTTVISGASAVTTACHVFGPWQGTTILFIDPTKGYSSWTGTTYTVIDATRLGVAGAVFEGRVWLANNRTISFTAPNTFTNFTAGDGAGSTILTDEAFPGNILALVSALEELWIVGQAAVDALSNVQSTGTSPNVVTTYAITNIISNLGSNAPNSVVGYLRALAFMAPFGIYALSGVTPQKISAKIDGLFPQLTLIPDVPAAVAIIQNLPCLLFLTTYTGTQAKSGSAPLPLLIGFTEGKLFFAVQNTTLKWITSLVVNGALQAWGTDGTHLFQLFGAAATTAIAYKIQGKLFDFGRADMEKALLKMLFEYRATNPVAPTLMADSEFTSVTVPVAAGNAITWLNSSGSVITWLNSSGQTLTWLSQALVLSIHDAPLSGHYLGYTIQGNDAPYTISTLAMEYATGRGWATP